MSDVYPWAHKREVAARAKELAEQVINQVAVQRMDIRHKLEEKAWHRVVGSTPLESTLTY